MSASFSCIPAMHPDAVCWGGVSIYFPIENGFEKNDLNVLVAGFNVRCKKNHKTHYKKRFCFLVKHFCLARFRFLALKMLVGRRYVFLYICFVIRVSFVIPHVGNVNFERKTLFISMACLFVGQAVSRGFLILVS